MNLRLSKTSRLKYEETNGFHPLKKVTQRFSFTPQK